MRAIVLLSGGIDSSVALYWAKKEGYDIIALSINYYYRMQKERDAVKYLISQVGAKLIEIPAEYIKDAYEYRTANISKEYFEKVPEGYMPSRNLLFYSMAIYYAECYQADVIIAGHIKSDVTMFPDAGPDFFNRLTSLANATALPTQVKPVKFIMPLMEKSKEDVIRLAFDLGVPLEKTWSCYYIHNKPCGKCKGCKERIKAFQNLKIEDPLLKINSIETAVELSEIS
jgi:7-cyano-7-deazaguanine synthase